MPKRTLAALSLIAFSFGASAAVTVTTGGGYVPMVEKLVEVCKNETAAPIEKSFGGNIGQMLAQVKSGSGVNVVVTDRTTLLKLKTPVKFSTMQTLGVSPLMLVWRKGVTITNPEDLAKDGVKRIAHPDPKAAVYGRAGTEWVAKSPEAVKKAVTPKLLGVAGVPQVMSYVLQGEVDAGFVNWQAAQKNRAKLGGVMVIEEGYEPIEMVAAVVAGAEKDADVRNFLGCLASPKGKKVLEKAGVPAEIDDSEEKLGYRLRKSQVEKVPYVLVLGDMEAEGRSVNLRAFGSEKQESLSLEEAIERLSVEVQERK